jgi:anti-sigma factor RsiW
MADDERIDELIHAWIDGELDPARADELLAALHGDRSLLTRVEAFERIADDARELPAPPLPPGFVERTMERVRSEAAPRRSFAWATLFQRRIELSLAQLGLSALALAAAVVFAGSFGFSRGQDDAARAIAASPVGGAELVRFTLRAEDATSVELAGSFNGWAPAPLTRLPDGTFEAVLPLPKGRHEYAYRVDGSWQADPAAKVIVDDGFGGRNAVIEL